MSTKLEASFFENIKKLLLEVQASAVKQVNTIMVSTYFEMGRQLVEHEQNGNHEAEYGAYIISELSRSLTEEFGKGYSKRNLELIRKFYITYKNAKSPISQSLSWTYYILLMRIGDENETGERVHLCRQSGSLYL
ncbi:DUF1016 N-terminal domain-containing protein [Algoriphagus sp. AGSA1]|uniref:DUF1016 N-terminal domain-containing protein n=1 Tax=Algoriphagus sp. AGSA1 TaxID=2907213 RepID=UPI001F3D1441|nr:DUF1016 N-terminal domain-containing protein [Algoriphagus sp. AGSA1]MCE7055967.1 DUF1016 N-terminal domain-containing protein [Algoriphagus sp. AGSA1]